MQTNHCLHATCDRHEELVSSPPLPFNIRLRFHRTTNVRDLARCQESFEVIRQDDPIQDVVVVRFTLDQFLRVEETVRRFINKKLNDWPIPEDAREGLIDSALSNVREIVEDEHIHCSKVLHVTMKVTHYQEHIFALAKKTLAVDENDDDDVASCAICMNEYYDGCEVAETPCSHLFHTDCIVKWLRRSNFCPICRFEMPTGTLKV